MHTETAVITDTKPRPRAPRRAADPAAQPLAVVEAKPDAGTLLRAIAQVAANPAVDIAKMERLIAMQQKIVAQDAEAAFNAAMARAQAQIAPVATNAFNDQTSSRYAKLSQINKAIMPVYTAEGLSVSFDTEDCPVKDHMRTVAIVSHAAGHSRRYHLDMPFDAAGIRGSTNKTMVHATGSTASYSRRYLLCMIFNVATEDDNDGNNGAGKTGAQAQVQQPPTGPQPYPEDRLQHALPEWRRLMRDSQKTAAQIIATVSTKWILSEAQKKAITDLTPLLTPADVKNTLAAAKTIAELDTADLMLRQLPAAEQTPLKPFMIARRNELKGAKHDQAHAA